MGDKKKKYEGAYGAGLISMVWFVFGVIIFAVLTIVDVVFKGLIS